MEEKCTAYMLTHINTVNYHASHTSSNDILHNTKPLPSVVLPLLLLFIVVWVRTQEFFHL